MGPAPFRNRLPAPPIPPFKEAPSQAKGTHTSRKPMFSCDDDDDDGGVPSPLVLCSKLILCSENCRNTEVHLTPCSF